MDTAAAWAREALKPEGGKRYEVAWPTPRETERLRDWAMAMDWDELPVAGYSRISNDEAGDEHGVTNQRERYIPKAASAFGWTVTAWYDDNDKSAVDPRVYRPDFHRLCADLDSGKVSGIVCQNVDRLVRRLDDLQILFNVWDRAKMIGRTMRPIVDLEKAYDLHIAADRMAIQFKVMVGDQEVQSTKRRLNDSHLTRAKSGGIPGGGRTFGWTDKRQALHPSESKAIREAAVAMIEDGVGWTRIARKWNEAGILTTFGKEWRSSSVHDAMTHPRNAGLRTYRGKLIYDDDGAPVRGQWPAIFTDEEWKVYYDLIAGKDRTTFKRVTARAHLLSGILRCSKCRAKMKGGAKEKRRNGKGGYPTYTCPPKGSGGCGSTSLKASTADEWVTELVFARAEQKATQRTEAAVPDGFTQSEELADLEETADLLQERLIAPGVKNKMRLLDQIEELDAKIEALRELKVRASARIERQARAAENVRDTWADLSLARKRAAITDALAAVIVKPGRGGRPAGTKPGWQDPDRLVPIWVEDAA